MAGSLPTGRQEGAQYERNFLPGKPRYACPVLTGWARSFTGHTPPTIVTTAIGSSGSIGAGTNG
ncbi:MAG TPA: hypothetical protein VMV04_09705 [Thermodesulfobacteriota bacterium]|nr:hypothetical protein [Thermodesulfobacteriota bacterium]